MDIIIVFFRDILNGPLYIIVAIICGILICSCIGYLAEQSQLKKSSKEEHDQQYAKVSNDNLKQETTSTQNNAPIIPNNITPPKV